MRRRHRARSSTSEEAYDKEEEMEARKYMYHFGTDSQAEAMRDLFRRKCQARAASLGATILSARACEIDTREGKERKL